MTNMLSGVGDALADEFTSSEETAPKTPTPAPAVHSCRYCSQTFEGASWYFQRGKHEKEKHHDERVATKAGVKPKGAAKKPAPKESKPRATKTVTGPVTSSKKRIPAGDSIARNLGRVAKMVTQADAPLGRALTFSAPATGAAIDEVVAGTFVDRMVVQRFAGAADKWEKFGGVIAFPVLIAVISRNPALLPMLEEDLREATLEVVISSIPTFEKKRAREQKAIDALSRLGKVDPRYAETNDPIGLILQDIFGPPVQADTSGETQ